MHTLPPRQLLPRQLRALPQPSPQPVDHVAAWRGLTQQGELAMARGDAVRARQLYADALVEADAIFRAALRGEEEAIRRAPPAYCISCHNVVTLALRQGDDATASIFLYRAFARLCDVAESRATLALRARCALFLDGASRALIHHLQRIGEGRLAQEHHARADMTIERVRRLQQMAVAQ